MKKLANKIGLFILLLVVLDQIAGVILEKLFYEQHHGDDYVSMQMMDSTKADILVFGSSRASHHYVCDSLLKYTNRSVYNAGRDNMGIHYILASLKIVLSRYTPKRVIIDLIPYSFLKGSSDVPKYLEIQIATLLPFANKHQSIYSSISSISQLETYKAKCIKTYAYNSLLGTIMQNAFTNYGHVQMNGYEPLDGNIDVSNYKKQIFPFPTVSTEIDTVAFQLLEQCIAICHQKHVEATLIFSPFYYQLPHYAKLEEKFKRLQYCHLLDYSRDSSFVLNANLFYDELHLNDAGANEFMKRIAKDMD